MKKLIAFGLIVFLTACGGGSDSGNQNSTFVGTYTGSTTIILSNIAGSESETVAINIFVRGDGVVEFSFEGFGLAAQGVLSGNSVAITINASVFLDEPTCSGTITLSGTFATAADGTATFTGTWSSDGAVCGGNPFTASGPINAVKSQ